MLLENIYLENGENEWVNKRLKWWRESVQSAWVDPNVVLSVPNVYLEVLFKHQNLIKELKNIDVFVETGTEGAGTADIMAKHFKKVYTIELNPVDSVEKTIILNDPENKNIDYLIGDSPKILRRLRKDIGNQRCVFLLDAHTGKTSCLEEELKVIKEYYNDSSVIIVDDGEDIGSLSFYPTLTKFEKLIKRINSDYNILFTNLGRKICLVYLWDSYE